MQGYEENTHRAADGAFINDTMRDVRQTRVGGRETHIHCVSALDLQKELNTVCCATDILK